MDEKIAAYIKKIESKLAGKNPMKVQSATAKELARLIKGATPAKLKKRPMPDKWSVTEVIAHLADSEMVVGWRLRSILGAPGTPIQAYDQDAWAKEGNYGKRDARKSLEQFRVLREMNLALVKSLTPEQKKRFGMHAERGEESIDRLVLMMAGHDINHTEQVEQILKRKK
jgi:DinB superfamily